MQCSATLWEMTALLLGETQNICFSSNFDLFWASTKPSNQTRRVYAAVSVPGVLESVATVSG